MPEHTKLKELCRDQLQVEAITCKHWAEGGAGAEELAHAVVKLANGEQKPLSYAYETETKITDKILAIATKLYGAGDIQVEIEGRHQARAVREGRLRETCPSAWPRPSTRSPRIRP